ncbi:MAG: tRNA threonylcarbamoyladenosine dehydratase, partial [Nitrosomonadales bacterium]|nr:tRNA threonylcarbamoyladenosine dehydratase [Nitrosomonadales bacterium]
ANLLSGGYDVILDAIDDAKAKVAIAAYCRVNKQPLVMTGGAGGRLDPTRIQSADFAKATGDRLLAKVRNQLRRDHGFPKGDKSKFGIQCIYSDEQVQKPQNEGCETDAGVTGLNCSGYGSTVCVTAPFGMAAAALVLNLLQKS